MTHRQLTSLSDARLLARAEKLAGVERRVSTSILLHLNEIERRQLHLKLGYGSLFDYCTEHLGYSAPAAGRRIQSARCMRKFPQVHEMLNRNEINLTTITMIAGLMTKENSDELLQKIRNKSKREVEVIKAEYEIPIKIRDRMKPVCVVVRENTPAPFENNSATLAGESDSKISAPDSRVNNAANGAGTHPRLTIQKRLLIEFSAAPTFMEKFEEVRGLLMHRFADRPSYEQVFDVVMDVFLDRYSPARRKKRREDRGAKAPQPTGIRTHYSRQREWTRERRTIPAAVRDTVYAKSGGKCNYVGTDGRRCNSTTCVQVDHIVPVARGGTNQPSNLRLLCAQHNRLEAERVYGADFMRQYNRRE